MGESISYSDSGPNLYGADELCSRGVREYGEYGDERSRMQPMYGGYKFLNGSECGELYGSYGCV